VGESGREGSSRSVGAAERVWAGLSQVRARSTARAHSAID